MRHLTVCLLSLVICACGEPTSPSTDTSPAQTEPPPIPEGAETVTFERPTSEESSPEPRTEASDKTTYWGVEEGEPLPLMWEDLMPEGSEEELMREYEAFYAMLEKRYAANTTTLADAGAFSGIEEGSELDFMPQLGSFDTVTELDGQLIRIPGYIVPFDFSSDRRQREFLFVPYMGACIHTPPPPPNQIIYIQADPPMRIKDIWVPYWIEGVLKTEKSENDLGDAAYSMNLDRIEPYPILQ